jgi:hypothetical protein
MNRRRFLRAMAGGGLVSVGLPYFETWLDRVPRVAASGSIFPTRFGLFFWGNGIVPSQWVPTTTGPDWELTPLLEPLAPVKDRITLVTGTVVRVPNLEPHWSGASGVLCGQPLIVRGTGDYTFPGATIDQVVAASIGSETRFRSIEYGARPGNGLSFNGPDNPNPPEASPFALYDRIFGEDFREPGGDQGPDPRLRFRRSVLDLVMDDISQVQSTLGQRDRQRLDQHLTSVREIETRLARLAENPANLEACRRPDTPLESFPDVNGRPQLVDLNRALCDIVALAMACDQTRVFTNHITAPLNNLLLAQATAGHHQLTHDEPGLQPMVQTIVRKIMGEFTYLVQALDRIPEGDGTLLDHSVIMATTDVSYGRTHSLDEFPLLYAGGGNGRLVTGTHVRSTVGDNIARAQLSMMRAAGVPAPSWGTADAYTESGYEPIER